MEEEIRKTILLLVTVSSLSAASSVFFHEPSLVRIYADVHNNHSDFGFAMGFHSKNKSLIIGAPRDNLIGKVYTCDINNGVEHEELICQEKKVLINHKAVTKNRKELENQHFFLGSSIAVSPDYFLTCAPLVTKSSLEIALDAVGTCFFLNSSKKQPRLRLIFDQLRNRKNDGEDLSNIPGYVVSGTGWTSLIDEDNGVLLIGKTSNFGDILHIPMNEPSQDAKSMILDDKVTFSTEPFFNVGFGITSGKFFSKETVYAFSLMTKEMYGVIEFLKYDTTTAKLFAMNANILNKKYTIKSKIIATMFGSALAAVDMNMDGWADLLVAAPAHTEENCVECGALHFYLGGNIKTIGDDKMSLQILGVKEYSRFSTAIVPKDLDGDGKPEIVVSAPYEDEGSGAVYILSGEELNRKLPQQSAQGRALLTTVVLLSELRNTQKIRKTDFKTLGFSLQFVSDANENGCSELAVGSPGSSSALLFKGIQYIKVTLTSKIIGNQIVKEKDTNFTMEVSVTVDYPHPPNSIYANLTVTNSIIDSNTQLPIRSHMFDISCTNGSKTLTFSRNFTVILTEPEEGLYVFSSDAKLHTDHIFNSTVFNSSWVVASSDSKLSTAKKVNRRATGDDRLPHLSMEISWSGSNPYVHGSTTSEKFVIEVSNTGYKWFGACVWVNVTGGIVSRSSDYEPYDNGYKYLLPQPFKRDRKYEITLPLIMTKPINVYSTLMVEAFLYETCDLKDLANSNSTKNKTIEYQFNTSDVKVKSATVYKNVTDKLLQDPNFSFIDYQEYEIVNNGIVRWEKVLMILTMKTDPFISSFKVSQEEMNCQIHHTIEAYNYSCYLNILPNSTQKIIATAEVLKSEVEKNLINGSLITSSRLELFLHPTTDKVEKTVITLTKYEQELTIANAMWLIIVISTLVGILVLIVVITILYRCGFFKRKEKQKLHVLRESIKRRNSRRNTFASVAVSEHEQAGIDGRRNTRTSLSAGIREEDIGDMDVEDDVFEVVELSKTK